MARLGVALLPLALAGACGGETSGGGATLSTGLPPDLVLNEASAGEQTRFCESLAAFAVDAADESCIVASLASSGDAGECRTRRAECLEEVRDPEVRTELTSDCELKVADPSCWVNVADAERCYNASFAVLRRFVATLSCSSDPQEARLTLEEAQSGLTACDALREQCPLLYEGESGGGSDDCCDPSDPCNWANDGACDCGGAAWDGNDCGASQPCCGPSDPCNWANDGACDCGGTTAWDVNDCGATDPCCGPSDTCNWANDGVCDCGGTTPWDAADCGG